jgi:ATP-dependent DNA helicase HFM1/MER3
MEQDRKTSYGKAVKSARQLVHVVLGKAWEDTSSIFRQIDSVGPKAIARLNGEGIQSKPGLYRQHLN